MTVEAEFTEDLVGQTVQALFEKGVPATGFQAILQIPQPRPVRLLQRLLRGSTMTSSAFPSRV